MRFDAALLAAELPAAELSTATTANPTNKVGRRGRIFLIPQGSILAQVRLPPALAVVRNGDIAARMGGDKVGDLHSFGVTTRGLDFATIISGVRFDGLDHQAHLFYCSSSWLHGRRNGESQVSPQPRSLGRWLALGAMLVAPALALGACGTNASNSVAQNPAAPQAAGTFAVTPYVDVTLTQLPDFNALKSSGATDVVFGFANSQGPGWSTGCVPTFGGYAIDSQQVQAAGIAAKSAGLNVGVSFGGQRAEGNDLAVTCNFVGGGPGGKTLADVYADTVKALGATRADFDVEGALAVNAYDGGSTSSFANRNNAIKELPGKVPGGVYVSYTMSTGPSGPMSTDSWGNVPAHLQAMAAAGMGQYIGNWNWMAFDWWTSQPANMGDAVNSSWAATNTFMASTFDYPLADIQHTSSVTAMIGEWDGPAVPNTQYFLPQDMATVSKYLRANSSPGIAFWSASRDNGSCAAPPGSAIAQPTCSGVAQTTNQFLSTAANPG